MTKNARPYRRDYILGPFWLIRRDTGRIPQYGWLAWRHDPRKWWVIDVWFRRTLWTLYVGRNW